MISEDNSDLQSQIQKFNESTESDGTCLFWKGDKEATLILDSTPVTPERFVTAVVHRADTFLARGYSAFRTCDHMGCLSPDHIFFIKPEHYRKAVSETPEPAEPEEPEEPAKATRRKMKRAEAVDAFRSFHEDNEPADVLAERFNVTIQAIEALAAGGTYAKATASIAEELGVDLAAE